MKPASPEFCYEKGGKKEREAGRKERREGEREGGEKEREEAVVRYNHWSAKTWLGLGLRSSVRGAARLGGLHRWGET